MPSHIARTARSASRSARNTPAALPRSTTVVQLLRFAWRRASLAASAGVSSMYCASLRKMRAVCGLPATQRTALRMQSWIASTRPRRAGGDRLEDVGAVSWPVGDDLLDHLLLRREVVVEAAGEDPGLLGDVAHGRRRDALLGEHAGGDREQLVAAGAHRRAALRKQVLGSSDATATVGQPSTGGRGSRPTPRTRPPDRRRRSAGSTGRGTPARVRRLVRHVDADDGHVAVDGDDVGNHRERPAGVVEPERLDRLVTDLRWFVRRSTVGRVLREQRADRVRVLTSPRPFVLGDPPRHVVPADRHRVRAYPPRAASSPRWPWPATPTSISSWRSSTTTSLGAPASRTRPSRAGSSTTGWPGSSTTSRIPTSEPACAPHERRCSSVSPSEASRGRARAN